MQEFWAEANNGLLWYPFDGQFFYVNAVAIAFAALATPIIYFIRRYSLRWQYGLEFCVFADLSDIGPTESVYESDIAATGDTQNEEDWIRILGVSETATIEEVKEAYKTLIKQNHPDRVQGMSQAFKKLTEVETKKINAAYRQALSVASPA